VDFDNILCLANGDTQEIALPDYLEHEPNTSYCYVVRRFNACGYSEQTVAAAVAVRLDEDGQLAAPAPNGVFGLKADLVTGHRIQLVWFYCPLDQQAEPEVFRIHTDNGVGQIDFETPIATVPYEGRKFYQYRTGALPDGLYRFSVATERDDQIGQVYLLPWSCPIRSHDLEGVTVLTAEAISQ